MCHVRDVKPWPVDNACATDVMEELQGTFF